MSNPHVRAAVHGLAIGGIFFAIWIWLVVGDPNQRELAGDGLVYWAVDPVHPYVGSTVGGQGAFLYSPAFAQAFVLVGQVPREVFVLGWTALLVAVAWWLASSWPLALLILALPVSQELAIGNVHLLLALAIVVGFRHPWAWVLPLLTKVLPGLGLLWFAVRGEWRSLGIALGATAAIVGISLALAPWMWWEWIALLRQDGSQQAPWLLVRLVIASSIVAWAGLTGRRWPVPVASMIALPVVWMDSISMLLALVPLVAMDRKEPLPASVAGINRAMTAFGRAPRSAPGPVVPPS